MSIQLMIAFATVPPAGLLVWRLVKYHLAERAKAYDAKRHRARIDQQLGHGHPPSWHGSDDRQEAFFAGAHWLATRKGVPGSYAQTVLGKEVNSRRLSWYVGLLEDQGASWTEQQMAVAEQVVEWWEFERASADDWYTHFES